jgi:FkbM family methyltransferase
MSPSMAHYVTKLRKDGFSAILRRKLVSFWNKLRFNNRRVGGLIELLGNRVPIDGLMFSVDSPLIATGAKSTMFFGLHELDERTLLKRWLPADLPVVEFGAGIGVVSCLTNRRLASPERHVVVELNPRVIPLLERNRKLNRCRFQILNKGLAYGVDTIEMVVPGNFTAGRHQSFVAGSTTSEAVTTVSAPSTTLKAIIDASGFDQLAVICDIEGAEIWLVENELDVLRQHVRFLLMELHPNALGEEAASRIIEMLQSAGFRLRDRSGRPELNVYNVVLTR